MDVKEIVSVFFITSDWHLDATSQKEIKTMKQKVSR
jgi:hypothetical protein